MVDSTSLLKELSVLQKQEKLKAGLDGGQEVHRVFVKERMIRKKRAKEGIYFSLKVSGN